MTGALQQASAAATRASGSNFYLAMRILPKAQREAMYEIYSFCRLVDDIADDGGPRAERLVALEQWRRDIDALYAGHPPARSLRARRSRVLPPTGARRRQGRQGRRR